jgi:predicted PurR-regulated permease PerM
VGTLIPSAALLVVGIVLALFMLLFLLKDWSQITTWTSRHMGVPALVAEPILQGTVRSLRSYAGGMTLIALANGLVVGLGAVILQVPLAGTIAIVTFVTAYVPYLGACFAGAFVLALGSGGWPVALAMFAIVLLANNTLQNLLEPFVYGRMLKLHPLVVLIVTTGGTLLFGVFGAILAAPLTSAGVLAVHELRRAGFFDDAGCRTDMASEDAGEDDSRDDMDRASSPSTAD